MTTNALRISIGWGNVPLSEVAHVTLGQTPKKSEYSSDGDRKILKFRDIVDFSIDWNRHDAGFVSTSCKTNLVRVQRDDLLIGASAHAAEHVGRKLALVGPIPDQFTDTFVVGEILRVRAISNEILPSWLYYYFRSQQGYESIQARVKGGHLTNGEARKLDVPIAPVAQQRRIVTRIEELFSELDDSTTNLEAARARLHTYRQSLLKHAFEGGLTEQWRRDHAHDLESAEQLLERIREERQARYQQQLEEWKAEGAQWEADGKPGKKPRKPTKIIETVDSGSRSDVRLPTLPSIWKWAPLERLNVDIFDGPYGSNLTSRDYSESGVRVIRLENIGHLKFKEEKTSYVSDTKYAQLKNHTVYPGDIVFASFVDEQTRVAIVPRTLPIAINKADCFCIRTKDQYVDARYLASALASRHTYDQVSKDVHGATRPRVNTKQLKSVYVPICSVNEQLEIVRSLEQADTEVVELQNAVDAALERTIALRQSILKRAFEDRLVTQDPDDESASDLLARIRGVEPEGAATVSGGTDTQAEMDA